MLKMLCVLLKVLILRELIITILTESLENGVTPGVSAFGNNTYNYTLSNDSSNRMILAFIKDGIPSEPTFPRAFVEFGNRLNEKDNISVTFRWNQPEFTNGKIKIYEIRYWFIENKNTTLYIANISAEQHILQYKVYNVKFDIKYEFTVQAYNRVGGGAHSNLIDGSTTYQNPVLLFLFISQDETLKVIDLDLKISFPLKEHRAREVVYLELERKIFFINDKWKLMTCDFDLNAIKVNNCTNIIDLHRSAHNLCIDWVARNLYWTQYDNTNENNFMKLDLTLWQNGIVKYDIIQWQNKYISLLNVLPFTGIIYWVELAMYGNGIIMQSDLNGENRNSTFLKNSLCYCPYTRRSKSLIIKQVDNTNIDNPLIYWIYAASNIHLIATDIHDCNCNLIFETNDIKTIFPYLTIDKKNLYLYDNIARVIYILEKKYALLESKGNAFKYVQKIDIHLDISLGNKLIALSNYAQPYPPTKCLVPDTKEFLSKVININFLKEVPIITNSIVINFPESVPIHGCQKYNLPTTKYIFFYFAWISYHTCLNNKDNKFHHSLMETYERHYEIQNLTPFTTYTLNFALSNFYTDKLSIKRQFSKDLELKTNLIKPNTPENVTVQILTPTLAIIYWMPPENINCMEVNYEVHWLSFSFTNGTQKRIVLDEYDILNKLERTADGKFLMTRRQLVPGREYLSYIRVYPINFSFFFNDSLKKSVYMYPEPNNLILSGSSKNSINISWNLSDNITYYTLKYKQVGTQVWQIANNTETYNDTVEYYIKNLLSGTLYNFCLILKYSNYEEEFIWPLDGEFIVKTHGKRVYYDIMYLLPNVLIIF